MPILDGRQYRLWCQWSVVQRATRANRVVVVSPLFDDDLCLPQCVEDFAIQQFVAEFAVERLSVAVFPWAAWLDIQRL